jgi:hypothetical protein
MLSYDRKKAEELASWQLRNRSVEDLDGLD